MKKLLLCSSVFFASLLMAETITSPNGKLKVDFNVENGKMFYSATLNGKPVLLKSGLGLEVANGQSFIDGFKLKNVERATNDSTWTPVWGETKTIRDHHNMALFNLEQKIGKGVRAFAVRFKVFDDGFGFRYEFPKADRRNTFFTIKDEKTEFAIAGDATAFWIPADNGSQEYEYTKSKLSEIRGVMEKNRPKGSGWVAHVSPTSVQTSLQLITPQGLYLNLHEAALVNYSCMHLTLDDKKMVFKSELVADPTGNKAYVVAPFNTPWRTVIVSEKATDILASKITLNLNEPCAIKDTSWIKPVKYVGVWWEMISGKSAWSYTREAGLPLCAEAFKKAKPHGRHGATTANVKRYIDFAAKHGFDQVLVEGWNIGWEDWAHKQKEDAFDFITPYPDFDLPYLRDYAKKKGVKLMMHHESAGQVRNYERRLDDALKFMVANGYNSIKGGYVGTLVPRGEFHYGQYMVDHYMYVVKKAAEYKVMINAHEAVRPTGLCRTYPNLIGNESARGTEFQAFGGTQPNHVSILPFTRLIGGPMDYTPGLFRMDISKYVPHNKSKVLTTLAHQLALYVTLYSPLQMAADFPEHYEMYPDAFQFIKDVAIDWDDTKYIDAEPHEFIIVARKAKGTDNWFAGCVSEDARTTNLKLDFLDADKVYEATIYADADNADYQKNPEAYKITKRTVSSKDVLELKTARGGGWAISFFAKTNAKKVSKPKPRKFK